MEREMKRAVPAFIFATLFVFTISYVFYPTELLPLPVGWDTPRYVWHMKKVAEDWNFIAEMDFNNFVYTFLGSLLLKLGVDAFFVEILLPPILLLILLAETYFLLTKLQPSKNWTIYTLIALSWFGAFRAASDLHNNLLALNLLLPIIYLLSLFLKKEKILYLGIVTAMLVLSSFVHIESTLFLAFIFFLTVFSEKSLSKIRRAAIAALLLTAILPAAILYYIHIKKLLVYSGGSFGRIAMDLWQWLVYLGPAGFIGVYELISEIRFVNRRDFLERFFIMWGFASIFFGLIQYLEPSFMIFSERAIILFPTPFLAIYKIEEVSYKIVQGIKSSKRKLKLSVPVLMVLFNLLIIMNFYSISISPEAYNTMLFLKQRFHNQPIIIVADYVDRYAGDLGQHIYNWGRAVIGEVYTYVGSVYYLRDLMPTPFFYWSSKQASNILFEDICSNFQSLEDAIIIYGLDFTDLKGIPDDFEAFMEPLKNDLYIINMTKLRETEGKLVIPIFQHSRVIYGNWYPSSEGWGGYSLVYECWMTGRVAQTPAIEVLFAVKEEGNYIISLSFWANKTTSLQVQVDGNQPQIFDGTENQEKVIVFSNFLEKGEHLLRVALLSKEPSGTSVDDKYLRARLNVLEVSKL
ncbi:MAG: hypothetical protein QW161_00935 [Candidatus Bathyarchaeia archaeon]